MNDSLNDNEEVYSKESKEESKDIESRPAYFILSYLLWKSRLHNTAIWHLHFYGKINLQNEAVASQICVSMRDLFSNGSFCWKHEIMTVVLNPVYLKDTKKKIMTKIHYRL